MKNLRRVGIALAAAVMSLAVLGTSVPAQAAPGGNGKTDSSKIVPLRDTSWGW
ncbi:hypothetical protein GCM10027026_19460 [Myroides odoratimimus subsp. xuanwuensis]